MDDVGYKERIYLTSLEITQMLLRQMYGEKMLDDLFALVKQHYKDRRELICSHTKP